MEAVDPCEAVIENPCEAGGKDPCEDSPKLQVVVSHGRGHLWSSQEVWRAWQECRVVGCLVGALPRQPHQASNLGLPLSLMPEEVTLLLEEGLGEAVRYREMEERPSDVLRDAFTHQREKCYGEQVEVAAMQRREEVARVADKILEGKRKKFLKKLKKEAGQVNLEGGGEEGFTLTKEDVVKEEVRKVQRLPPHLQAVEVFTGHPFLDRLVPELYLWPCPTSQKEKVRLEVFRDLWRRGHYLTPGTKFGGDFLVYPGDPHLYHAHSVVRCVGEPGLGQVETCDLVAATRVAAATKKTFVLATLDCHDEVVYQSYHWLEEEEEEKEEDEEIMEEEL